MSKRWFLWRVVAALVFVGLLIAGGLVIYYLGWSQGYGTSQLTSESEGGAPLPYLPYGLGYVGRPFAFAMCTGLIFKIGLLVLLFCIIGKVLRCFAWGMFGGPWMMSGPWSKRWASYWRRYHHHAPPFGPHGPVPPWCWDWEKPSDEEMGAAGSGADASNAEV